MSYDLLAIWIGWKTKGTGPGVFSLLFSFLNTCHGAYDTHCSEIFNTAQYFFLSFSVL